MKFIRDIIGEKRQMDKTPNGAPVDSFFADELIMNDADVTEETEAGTEQEVNDLAENAETPATEETVLDSAEAEEEASDFAEVFDEVEDASTADDAEDVSEDAEIALKSETPVESEEEDLESASTGEDFTKEIDRVLVSEHEPDESLERVFRAMNEPSGESPTPEGTDDTAEELSEEPMEPDAEMSATTTDDPQTSEPEAPLHAPNFSEFDPNMPPVQTESTPIEDSSQPVEMPRPAVGRGASRHGRVKTRLLGFNTTMQSDIDPIKDRDDANSAPYTMFPVGWLMVVEGEGRGSTFTLFNGVNNIGRGEDQTVRLDFGDNAISRENHASIAYDPRHRSFFIGHGGKANIVRRNDRPVLSTEEMASGDHITIGETTLRFVPLCGPDFDWDKKQETGDDHATRN